MSPLASLLAAALLAAAWAGDAEKLYGIPTDNVYRWPPTSVAPGGGIVQVTNVCGTPRPHGVRVHATNGPDDRWPDIDSLNEDHTQLLISCTPKPPYYCTGAINVVVTQYCDTAL